MNFTEKLINDIHTAVAVKVAYVNNGGEMDKLAVLGPGILQKAKQLASTINKNTMTGKSISGKALSGLKGEIKNMGLKGRGAESALTVGADSIKQPFRKLNWQPGQEERANAMSKYMKGALGAQRPEGAYSPAKPKPRVDWKDALRESNPAQAELMDKKLRILDKANQAQKESLEGVIRFGGQPSTRSVTQRTNPTPRTPGGTAVETGGPISEGRPPQIGGSDRGNALARQNQAQPQPPEKIMALSPEEQKLYETMMKNRGETGRGNIGGFFIGGN